MPAQAGARCFEKDGREMDSQSGESDGKVMALSTAMAALALGAAAMGASPIFVRFAANDVGPFASAFWRVFLALPVLYAWMARERTTLPAPLVPVGMFSRFSVLAGLAFAGDLIFWHLSIMHTTVANSTFFAAQAPVFVMGITWLLLRQPIPHNAIAGAALCLCGGAVLVGKTIHISPENLVGDLYGVCTAVLFALYFLAIGAARRQGESSARIMFAQTTVTAAGLFVAAAGHSIVSGAGFFPATGWGFAPLVGLAFISHVGGQGLLTVAMGRLSPVFSSLAIFLEAVVAAILGWLFLSEKISLMQAAGGLIILVGVWIARPSGGRKERGAAAEPAGEGIHQP